MSKQRKLQSGEMAGLHPEEERSAAAGSPANLSAPSLPAEIEQTLKRVNEGVEDWDALWDKLEETEVRAARARQQAAGAAGRNLPRPVREDSTPF